MNNFTLTLPTKIYFGKGQIQSIATAIAPDARVLLVYGHGSIKKNGVYDQVKDALGNRFCVDFSGIEANPEYSTCLQALPIIKEHNLNFILAVGGGSVLDAAKFIAAARYEADPWSIIETGGADLTQAMPLGTVLTLAATGSEMNMVSVISRSETGDKKSFRHPLVYPQFSVLDPTATFTVPKQQTANGIVDAFTHIIEQYLTYPVDAKVQDEIAEGLLRTLIVDGPLAIGEPNNYQARANIMWASTMALNGIIGAGVPQDWSTHAIGHELTSIYGIAHGETLALILPLILESQKTNKFEKCIQYGKKVWKITNLSDEDTVDLAIAKTKMFFKSLGMKDSLKDYGVTTPDAFGTILDKLVEHKGEFIGERNNIDKNEVKRILYKAL